MKKLISFTLILLLNIAASFAEDATDSTPEIPELIEGSGSSQDDATTTTEPYPDYLNCEGVCPLIDPVETSIYLSHLDCQKFCHCSNSQPIVLHCPGNLQFNRELNVCDYPDSANCTGIGGVLEGLDITQQTITLLNKK